MATYTCESCKYSTTRNWLYKDHLTSKKHIAMQTSETSESFRHVCTYCSKKYVSTTGLKKHNIKCASRIKHEEEARLAKEREYINSTIQLAKEKEHSDLIFKIKEELQKEMKDQMKDLLKEEFMLEMKEEWKSQLALQPQLQNSIIPPPSTILDISTNITNNSNSHNNIVDIANSAITNNSNSHNVTYRDINNNTSIHQNVHVYLNTHCNDTPSINDFIDKIQFSKAEIDQIVRAHQGEPIHKALIRVFKSKLQDIPFQQRPLHCVKPPESNARGDSSLFVMDDQEWKEENTGKLATQIRDVEVYDDDTDMEDAPPEEKTGELKTPLNKATAKFTRKMHDVCEELYSDKIEQSKAEDVMMKIRKCSTIGDLVESLETMPEIALDPSQIDPEA
jgi:hypothetical protein